jgi:peptidylprolyl isomerase
VDDPPDRRVDWTFLRAMGARPRLALDTERGRIVVELDAEEAPLTVQTVLQLAQEGRYDGVPFHRVVPDFVIQGGDFERGDGYGGPGFAIRSEFTRIPFARGTIGMASAGKDTEGSQFFLTHSAQPHLDGRYTAFGRVVQGMEVVDAILEGERVRRASVQVRSPGPDGGG